MNKRVKISVVVFSLLLIACISVAYNKTTSDKKKSVITGSLIEILNAFHFSPEKLDDVFSEKAYNLYIKRLDYDKMYLSQEDVKVLETYKYKIDDELKAQKFNFFALANEILDKKIAMVKALYPQLLGKPFDLDSEEFFETDDEKRGFVANDSALVDLWRKSLKLQVLQKIQEIDEDQKKSKSKNDTVVLKTRAQLEIIAREKIKKRFDDRFKRFEKIKDKDRFSNYINAIVCVYDPHTNYFPPEDKEDFDIKISGKLEGIGATLSEKDGYIKVESLVPGSASWRQGQLQASDIILKVGQVDDEPVDITGMPLDEAVRLIRGPKGTKVVLTVKKSDGSIIKIPIIRDIVVIEDTYAKSTIITDKKKNSKVGYLYLPQFYLDFNDSHGRNCSVDVLKEITKLKDEKVDAIIFDLRDNGGGSLNDVVKIAGFFIPSGPVVQVKSRSQAPQVLSDIDSKVYYDGPLVVMVDEFSASASEIFAAAMQDYGRAIIVGSNSTFGKGTVQRFVNLDDYLSRDYDSLKPLGQAKITIQKFYRVNGGTTQLKGVIPDIILPDKYSYLSLGEKEQDNPMKWDEISPVSYVQFQGDLDIKKVKKLSDQRVSKDTLFQKIKDAAQYLKTQKDNTIFPLSFDQLKQQESEEKKRLERFNSIGKSETGLVICNEETLKAANKLDSLKMKRIQDWYQSLKKDVLLFETYKIANNMLGK